MIVLELAILRSESVNLEQSLKNHSLVVMFQVVRGDPYCSVAIWLSAEPCQEAFLDSKTVNNSQINMHHGVEAGVPSMPVKAQPSH
jgi:hypothetical protein